MIPARNNYLDNLFWEEMSGYFILGKDVLDIYFWKVNFPRNDCPHDILSLGIMVHWTFVPMDIYSFYTGSFISIHRYF